MRVYASAEMTLTDTNDGISVTGIDRYYMASSYSSGITVDSSGWKTDPQETNPISRYHWSYEVVNYSSGSPVPTKPAIIGVYGDSAKMLYLSATAESMTFDADGTPNPSSQVITLTANLQNVSGNASFVATAYNGSTVVSDVVLSGAGNTRTFNQAQFPASANRVQVRATLGNLVDTVTIVKLANGSNGQNAVVGLLTNESITLPANKDGLVSSFTGAKGIFDVYDGITKKTNSNDVKYSVVSQSNITVNINATTGAYSVTAMPTGTTVLNGYAVLSAIYNGVTIEKQLNVSKSVTGATGATGASGKDGIAGKDGKGISSTTITYGLSTTDTVEPTSYTSNVPTLVKGRYLWTKTVWKYTDTTTETGYSKTYIAKDGNNGTDGIAGKDGVGISNTKVEYAGSTSGTAIPTSEWKTAVPTVAQGSFLWTRTTWTYTDNTTETGYSVARMGSNGATGAQGPQGIQGPAGTNGTSQYVHIRYSANSNGSDMTPTPQSNTQYIGLANTTSAKAPTVNTSYTWTKTKGETGAQGNQGIQGPAGTNGQTTYTWVKYADTNTGTEMNDNPDGKLYIGLAFNKTTQTESDTASDYTWSLMPQNIEVGGENLINGTAGGDKGFFKEFTNITDEYAELTLKSKNQYNYIDISEFFSIDGKDYIQGDKYIWSYEIMYTSWNFPDGTSRQEFWMGQRYEQVSWDYITAHTLPVVGQNGVELHKWYKNQAIVTIPANRDDGSTTSGQIQFYNPNPDIEASFTMRIKLKTLKLEKGNTPTDWRPSQQDIQAELDDKASNGHVDIIKGDLEKLIGTTEKGIETMVSQKYVETNTFNTISEKVTKMSQSIDGFDFTFDSKSLIDNLNEATGEAEKELQTIRKYIQFTSNGSIILGASDSPSKVEITRDKISFKQNDKEVAWFSNQSFNIESGTILTDLQVGDHKFEKSGTGRTRISYAKKNN